MGRFFFQYGIPFAQTFHALLPVYGRARMLHPFFFRNGNLFLQSLAPGAFFSQQKAKLFGRYKQISHRGIIFSGVNNFPPLRIRAAAIFFIKKYYSLQIISDLRAYFPHAFRYKRRYVPAAAAVNIITVCTQQSSDFLAQLFIRIILVFTQASNRFAIDRNRQSA